MSQMEVKKLIEQVQKLHGSNWSEVDMYGILEGLSDELVNTRVTGTSNTIHQIARHHLATEFLVIKRLQGVEYVLTADEDWVPANKIREFLWSDTIKAIRESRDRLVKELDKLSDEDLDKLVLEGHSSIYETICGHIQHSYYHLGQIMVLRKLLENN